MPIYEFLCEPCNTIYSFHSFRVNTGKVPACPRCGHTGLRRVPSAFGVATARSQESAGEAGDDADDPRLEREMMRLASELEGMDDSDPRQMARAVRKMTELAGEPITPAMEEMIRRLEAGEDPDRIEEDLGDALEEEAASSDGPAGGPAPSRDDRVYPM